MVSDERLAELKNRLSEIPSPKEPTATTLEILGESKREAYWESLLVYFLDASAPHGFETDILEAFLQGIAKHNATSFQLGEDTLGDVKIDSQVQTGQGVPDILIWKDREWFICLELKATAPETKGQTQRYVDAKSLGEIRVHDYAKEDRHYVYLADRDAPSPVTPDFIHISWQHIVEFLDQGIVLDSDRYHPISIAQYLDFVETVERTFRMTEYTKATYERAHTGIEYADVLDELDEETAAPVSAAIDELIEQERRSWRSEFEQFTSEQEQIWMVDREESFGRIYRPEWVFPNTDEVSDARDGKASIVYMFRVDENAAKQQKLTINLKIVRHPPHDSELCNHIYNHFYENRELLDDLVHDAGFSFSRVGKKSTVLESVQPWDITGGDSVGSRLISTIGTADLLNKAITDIFQDAVPSSERT